MEKAITLILQTAIKQHLNIGGLLDLRSLIQNPDPVIKNNLPTFIVIVKMQK